MISPAPDAFDMSHRTGCAQGEETQCKMEYGNDGCCARQVYEGETTFFCSYIPEVAERVESLKALSDDNELYCDGSNVIQAAIGVLALILAVFIVV